jgi:ATP-dependent DNA helicase DinG
VISLADTSAGQEPTDWVEPVREIFSQSGLLSRASNFEYRPEQQQMAMAVASALQDRRHLLVEAGTGVGKSFAYLIPAILFAVGRKKKAVISTHTINLQEQLVEKDLPVLKQVLPVDFSYAMLKGRSNYLCTRRLRKAMQQCDSLFTSPEAAELRRIEEWSRTTQDGSLSDFSVEPDPKVCVLPRNAVFRAIRQSWGPSVSFSAPARKSLGPMCWCSTTPCSSPCSTASRPIPRAGCSSRTTS